MRARFSSSLLALALLVAAVPVSAQTNTLTNLWRVALNSEIQSSPAIGPDGTIYFGSFRGDLYAFHPDGSPRWKIALGTEIRSSPAIAPDGTILFGSRDNHFYAMTPAGKLKWRFATAGWVDSSPALENDGTIYFGSWDGKLYALRADGTKKWEFATGGIVSSSPALAADGTIYFGSHDHKFYALNPDGSKKWEFPTGNEIVSSPAIAADGSVFFSSTDGRLYALTPAGKRKWAVTTGSFTKCSPAIDADGNIYTDAAGKLISLKPDGTERWRCEMIGALPFQTSPAIAADGQILVYQRHGGFAAVGQDGKFASDRWVDGPADASPALDEKGVVYVGADAASFVALGYYAPLAKAPWPMFRHDPRHTGKATASP